MPWRRSGPIVGWHFAAALWQTGPRLNTTLFPPCLPPFPCCAQGSKQLKDEGNELVAAGRFEEAATKYQRAKANLADMAAGSREASELRRACSLNLGMCWLKLGRNADAVEECSAVLEGAARARGGRLLVGCSLCV